MLLSGEIIGNLGPPRGIEPRSAAYETAILPVEIQRHHAAPDRALFSFFGVDTPGPEFRGISRERGRRSLTRHARGSDHPLGAHTSPRRSEKADHGSRGCPAIGWPCRGGRAGLRAAEGGNRRRRRPRRGGFLAEAGLPSGYQAGKKRRTAAEEGAGGCESRTLRRLPRELWSLQVSGSQAKPGSGPPFPGRSRAKTRHHQAEKGRLSGLQGRPRRALGAKKPLFAAKVLAEGLCWGENWREELAGREGLSGPLQVIFGRTGRKRWGLCEALSRTYRKKTVPAPFLCR